jgi:hypothetical protein
LAWSAPAAAAEPERIGGSRDWSAYVLERGGGKVCYMVSLPKKSEGNYTARGDVFALVTNDPGNSTRGEVSIVTGYTYKQDSMVSVRIGGTTFDMFTDKDRAWTQGPEEDAPLVSAMVKGSDMIVKGTSSRGTLTTDTYSLSGFTATKKLIDNACK